MGNICLELQKASRNEPVDCQMWESWRHSRMRTSGRWYQEMKLSGFNQTVLQEVKIIGGYKNTKLEPPLDDCVMVFLCFTIWADVFSGPLRFQRADWHCQFAFCKCRGLFVKGDLVCGLEQFLRDGAMTICAWFLATQKYRARCNPNSRFIVPKQCSIRKRWFEISL